MHNTRVFVAVDFETANRYPDSACCVGLVRVEGTHIAARVRELIRPQRGTFQFAWLHGIDRATVAGAPGFGCVWRGLEPILHGAEFLAAHNAAFDRAVLRACCSQAAIRMPRMRFRCTMALARKRWGIVPTTLPEVCRRLGIPLLRHHDALADAEACARIVLAAED